jgi:hypothetical protein
MSEFIIIIIIIIIQNERSITNGIRIQFFKVLENLWHAMWNQNITSSNKYLTL